MKYFIRFFFIIFIIFYSSSSYSESLIAFLDMNKIMLQSKAGKSITIQLEKLHKKNIDTFKKKEEEMKQICEKIKNVLGNKVEKAIPTLDFIWKNKIKENMELNFSAKNILDPTIEIVREGTPFGDVTLSEYKRGINVGFQFKYNF